MPAYFLNENDRRLSVQVFRRVLGGQGTKRPFARRRRHPYPITKIATIIKGKTVAAVGGEDTFDGDQIEFLQSNDAAVIDAGTVLTIQNTDYNFSGDLGATFHATKAVGEEEYHCWQMRCPGT